jgi:hypothetical protein
MTIHIVSCRCGKARGHVGLCNGEVETPPLPPPKPDSSEYDHMNSLLINRYGPKAGSFLAKRIAKHMRKKDCLSHFRVADVDMPEELAKYEEIQSGGCCGSVDEEIQHYPTARRFKFGFNFGH